MRQEPHRMGFILSRMRATRRLLLLVVWTVIMVIPTAIFRLCGLVSLTHKCTRLWHKGLLKIINIKASLQGEPLKKAHDTCGVLLVGNHISYLDIVVLGALFPCRFIAKSEVSGWPVLGLLSKLQYTIFVRRQSRTSLPKTQKQITAGIFKTYPYVLFAEGTSGDGTRVLPFRSSLMQLAVGGELPAGKDIAVQAFALQYRHYGGLPVDRYHRPYFGWYGDMGLSPHVWDLLSLPGGAAEVRLASAISGKKFTDRKDITAALQEKSEAALQELREM